MAYTYKSIDPESGNRWCVRIVSIGDQYGLKHCLTYGEAEYDKDKHDDPMIEFYDMDSGAAEILRNSADKTEAYLGKKYGQFVSRYYYSTLKMRDPLGKGSALTDWSKRGLCLHGGVDGWSVSSEFMVKAMTAINTELEAREMQDA
jgi:hypothetical protein